MGGTSTSSPSTLGLATPTGNPLTRGILWHTFPRLPCPGQTVAGPPSPESYPSSECSAFWKNDPILLTHGCPQLPQATSSSLPLQTMPRAQARPLIPAQPPTPHPGTHTHTHSISPVPSASGICCPSGIRVRQSRGRQASSPRGPGPLHALRTPQGLPRLLGKPFQVI